MNLVERTWYASPSAPVRSWLAPLLRTAALGYAGISAVRGFIYDQRYLGAERVEAKVISVGNLTVGGAGKTPVTLLLCQRLLAQGKRVAVLSRGYGGRGPAGLVGAEGKLFRTAREAGDEPVLLARRAPGAAVLVGADRVRIARQAIRDHRAEVLLLDDGFQHRRLARDEDVLVLGGARPLGNGALLPAGPLREAVDGVARASVAWLSNGAEQATLPERLPRRRVVSRHVPSGLTDLGLGAVHGLEALQGKRVLLFAGLARPGGFAQMAAALGAQVVGSHFFPDHHRFSPQDLLALQTQAQVQGAELLLTTEKDAVRLGPSPELGLQTAVLRIEVEVLQGDAVVEELCAC